jgi:hypothetical protein
MTSILQFIDALQCNQDLLYRFILNPFEFSKKYTNEEDVNFKTEIESIGSRIQRIIENTYTELNPAGDSKFRKAFVNKIDSHDDIKSINTTSCTNYYVCVDAPCVDVLGACQYNEQCADHCMYTSDCEDVHDVCVNDNETSCQDGGYCLNQNCVNNNSICNDSAPGCHPTDEGHDNGCVDISKCRDVTCENQTNKCTDYTNCIDTTCINNECTDTTSCIDAGTCKDDIECQDGGYHGGCFDVLCRNGNKCGDMTTCLDTIGCLNSGQNCTDAIGCQDSMCINSGSECADADCLDLGCGDNIHCSDKKCDNNKCSDSTTCVHNICKDDKCNHETCIDQLECTDTDDCHDAIGKCSDDPHCNDTVANCTINPQTCAILSQCIE